VAGFAGHACSAKSRFDFVQITGFGSCTQLAHFLAHIVAELFEFGVLFPHLRESFTTFGTRTKSLPRRWDMKAATSAFCLAAAASNKILPFTIAPRQTK
jgi:hypothetical protein